MGKEKKYKGREVDVTFDIRRCIHAEQCVKNLPKVFDPQRRPWIEPDQADKHSIIDVVHRCPTGALRYVRRDGGPDESPGANSISVGVDGPLWVTGDITIRSADGAEVSADNRVALCRCGASKAKPFCDGKHSKQDFKAPGGAPPGERFERPESDGKLVIVVAPNGPLLVQSQCRLKAAETESATKVGTALCRCGASENKPFCDGGHTRIGFEAE
jgi:CDGSH-type Zn-finger protein/uncharacterized Fe-S cluster protein YjdI